MSISGLAKANIVNQTFKEFKKGGIHIELSNRFRGAGSGGDEKDDANNILIRVLSTF